MKTLFKKHVTVPEFIVLSLFIFFVLFGSVQAAHFKKLKPEEWPWRGINISSHTNPAIDINRIADADIKYVFLRLHPTKVARRDGIDFETAWQQTIEWTDEALDICGERELICSVGVDDVPFDPSVNYSEGSAEFWDNPQYLADALVRFEEIAIRYGDREEVGHFQFISEPSYPLENRNLKQPDNWPAYFEEIRLAVRRHTDKWLGYSPGPGGLVFNYNAQLPIDDPKIIYTAHGFRPHPYTHQGVYSHYPYGLSYPGVMYESTGEWWNARRLKTDFDRLRTFQRKYRVPVMIGSFSAVRWAPEAERFLNDMTRIFRRYDWGYAYWSFGGYHGWNPDYDTTFDLSSWQSQYVGFDSARWNTLRKILR